MERGVIHRGGRRKTDVRKRIWRLATPNKERKQTTRKVYGGGLEIKTNRSEVRKVGIGVYNFLPTFYRLV